LDNLGWTPDLFQQFLGPLRRLTKKTVLKVGIPMRYGPTFVREQSAHDIEGDTLWNQHGGVQVPKSMQSLKSAGSPASALILFACFFMSTNRLPLRPEKTYGEPLFSFFTQSSSLVA